MGLDATFQMLEEQTSYFIFNPTTMLSADDVESRYSFVEDSDGHFVELIERSANHPTNEWK